MYSFNPLLKNFDKVGPTQPKPFKVVFCEDTTFTLLDSASSLFINFTNLSGCTITIPNDATTYIPPKTEIQLSRLTEKPVYCVPELGVNLRSCSDGDKSLRANHSVASLLKLSANEWILYGDVRSEEALLKDIPWVPDYMDTLLWVDAEALWSVNVAAGTNSVVRWQDKSGHNYHLYQNIVANQPIANTSLINGKKAVSFSSPTGTTTVRYLSNDSAFIPNQPFCFFCVVERAGGTASSATIFDSKSSGGFGASASQKPSKKIAINASGTDLLSNSVTGPFLLSSKFDATTSSISINGDPHIVGNPGVKSPKDNLIVGVDKTFLNTQTLNGSIGELLFTDGALPLSSMELVEGYLAWKWDLVSSLPATHTYKTHQPTLADAF